MDNRSYHEIERLREQNAKLHASEFNRELKVANLFNKYKTSSRDREDALLEIIESVQRERDDAKKRIEQLAIQFSQMIDERNHAIEQVESLQRDKAALIEVLEKQLCVRHDGSTPDEWDGSLGGGGHKECRKLALSILTQMKG